MATQVTHTPTAVKVQWSAAPGSADPGPGDYGVWGDAGELLPPVLLERLAPDVSCAKFPVNLPAADSGSPLHAWQWKSILSVDDRLALVKRSDASRLWFVGFVVDVDVGWGRRDERVTVTVAGNAFRLKRDVVVYGRYMADQNEAVNHFSGLACDFNAGGKPNRCPTESFEAIAGGPAAGVAFFTADDADDAEFWRPADVLDYLLWRYNADETWIANPTLSAADYARTTRMVVSCEGLDLWTALAAAADADGYDVAERFDPDADGSKASSIVVVRRGSGSTATLKRLGADYGEAAPAMDLAAHTVFDSAIAHAAAPAVTSPIVAGGVELVELTIELGKAWDASRLALGDGEDAAPEFVDKSTQFYARYCRGGADFADYADVGRLWDANTDGRYSGEPYSLSVPDVAALAGEDAGTWPEMPYRPLPMTTCLNQGAGGVGRTSQEFVAEISFDSGSTWHPLADVRSLPDRVGLWIKQDNLAAIWEKDADADGDNNYLRTLLDNPGYVEVRMTVTIPAPTRAVSNPDRQASAATAFSTAAWFDRGTLGQKRRVAAGSVFSGSGLRQDTCDGCEGLTNVAEAIQAALEGSEIEAALAVEWPDEDVHLTDVVHELAGINYSFQTNAGASPRYVRIVGLQRHFGVEEWAMTVVLGTDRKAPLG